MTTTPVPLRMKKAQVRQAKRCAAALGKSVSALIRFAVITQLEAIERGELVISGAKEKRGQCIDSFRAPTGLLKLAKAKAKSEDISFSQLMRRALRKELEGAVR